MNLYEIDKEILNLIDEETGEISDWGAFEQLQMERERKIKNVALWVKNLTAEAEACKKEKLMFNRRQRSCESKIESLKMWLNEALEGKNYKSDDGKATVQFRKTTSVSITDDAILPTVYLRYKDPEPDKEALKEALKAGARIEGVTLEPGVSVIVK